MTDIIKTLAQLKKALPNYIEYIRLPRFKEIEENTQIDFTFPLTVFVGANGTRKSSVLKGLQGCPKDRSPRTYWFSTKLDPINDEHGKKIKKTSIIHAYKADGEIIECLKLRAEKKGRGLDYWETSRPRDIYGMEGSEREEPIKKHVEYLNFRSLLPAFDKCFYYSGRSGVQDYIRNRTPLLQNAILTGLVRKMGSKVQNEIRIKFTPEKLKFISSILSREYVEGAYIRHRFFDGWAETVVLNTDHFSYSEAFAGSGEIAIAVLVHKIEDAPEGSLIILDEPEVSLHPEAQKNLQKYLLQKIKDNKHQIVISTHSPFIVEGLPKEAIKAFRVSGETGTTEIIQNINSAEAFSVIGYVPATNKKVVWVEDVLAKTLLDQHLAYGPATRRALFDIRVIGSDSQMYKDIAHSCNKEETQNYFYVIDGDNFPDLSAFDGVTTTPRGTCNVGSITNGNMNTDYLGNIVKTQSKGQTPDKIGLNKSIEVYRRYLEFMADRVMYLPATTPEDLIWSSEIAQTLMQSLGINNAVVTATLSKIEVETSSKSKFSLLAEVLAGGNKGTDILTFQKMFITNFYNTASPDAAKITNIIDYIANLVHNPA